MPPELYTRLVWRDREGPTGSMSVISFLRVCLDVLKRQCVCVCVGDVGGDHLVSDDLRERRVACACVYERKRKCVYVGARVPACKQAIVCLGASVLIVCACVPANARARACVHQSRRLLHLPTLSHPSIHPFIRPSLQDPSIHSRAIYHFPCSEGGSQKPT